MRKLILQFLNFYYEGQSTDLDSSIKDFLQNYDPKTVPSRFRSCYDYEIPEIIKKNEINVGFNIRQGIMQGLQAIEDDDLLETVLIEFFSVDGIDIKLMNPEERKKAYHNFEWKAKACPILPDNYLLYCYDDHFELHWFVPIPIKTSCFSDKEIQKIQDNILQYFQKYFSAKAKITHFSYLSEPHAVGAECLYKEIIFRELYYNAFGLELNYKLKELA